MEKAIERATAISKALREFEIFENVAEEIYEIFASYDCLETDVAKRVGRILGEELNRRNDVLRKELKNNGESC